MSDQRRLLVVDDDREIRDLVSRFLAAHGYKVVAARDAREMAAALTGNKVDLVILDVMLPGRSGLELCRELRAKSDIPILMLTAMGDTKDRIAGLETGVDDYLGKPFEPRELLLRIQNVLKRNRAAAGPPGEPQRMVSFGPFQFDQELGELTNKGKRAPLTDAETALLRVFTARLGEVLSRETLCKSVGAAVNERAIDVQVTRLRRKIEPDPGFPRYLRTVRGQGYRLVDA